MSRALLRLVAIPIACLFAAGSAGADSQDFLADRGPGVTTSMFGTYVEHRELVLYTFYEYTLNRNQEYKPEELGFGDPHDYRARRTDHEALVFFSYGVTPDLAIEGESALWTTATQEKSPQDPSAMPSRLKESGFGDTEGQIRW